jgi:hypothetical protein
MKINLIPPFVISDTYKCSYIDYMVMSDVCSIKSCAIRFGGNNVRWGSFCLLFLGGDLVSMDVEGGLR